jgi:hypothetical protein
MTEAGINFPVQNETLLPSVTGKDPRLLKQVTGKAERHCR